MPTLGAIDIGSNGIRLAVGSLDAQGRLHPVEDFREPVRLGEDVFTRGFVTRPTLDRALRALTHFKNLLRHHHVERVRAVATSALREAKNRDAVVRAIRSQTGLDVRPISGEEEARLVRLAVESRVDLSRGSSLLVDVGGGSVEVTLLRRGRTEATESFNMGAVRLLKMLEADQSGEERFNRRVEEYAEAARRRVAEHFGGRAPSLCVGTGGNLDELGSLRRDILGGRDDRSFSREDLAKILGILKRTPYEDRVKRIGMRPDRADVILPAAVVVEKLIRAAGVRRVQTPHVGLKEGLLLEMASQRAAEPPVLHRKEAVESALRLGRKYAFDEAHARQVTDLALSLFDQTRRLHRLGDGDRLLLEVSGLLHDIGQFISLSSHHKHSYYLIRSSRLAGLDEDAVSVVAHVARYHRKSPPKMKHETYRSLSPLQRSRVTRLAAILRVADALDYEHRGAVRSLKVARKGRALSLRLRGKGELLLEHWALMRKGSLFEKTFKVHLASPVRGQAGSRHA